MGQLVSMLRDVLKRARDTRHIHEGKKMRRNIPLKRMFYCQTLQSCGFLLNRKDRVRKEKMNKIK